MYLHSPLQFSFKKYTYSSLKPTNVFVFVDSWQQKKNFVSQPEGNENEYKNYSHISSLTNFSILSIKPLNVKSKHVAGSKSVKWTVGKRLTTQPCVLYIVCDHPTYPRGNCFPNVCSTSAHPACGFNLTRLRCVTFPANPPRSFCWFHKYPINGFFVHLFLYTVFNSTLHVGICLNFKAYQINVY